MSDKPLTGDRDDLPDHTAIRGLAGTSDLLAKPGRTRLARKGGKGECGSNSLPLGLDCEVTRSGKGYAWSASPPEGWTERQSGHSDKAFLRPAWFAAWSAAYESSGSWRGPLRYLSASSNGRLSAILPIAIQTVNGTRFASLAGCYLPFRSPVIFTNSGGTADQLAAGLAELKDVWGVRFGPVHKDDAEFALIADALRRIGWRLLDRAISTAFLIRLPATIDEYEATLSKKRKKRIRYHWNRMCKSAETVLSHYNDIGWEDWIGVFTELSTIETASWLSNAGEPRFNGERNLLFWTLLSKDPWMRAAMNAWIIHYGRQPVSFCFALDSGTTRYILANTYDRRVAQYSTGSKIYDEVIQDAIRRGLRTIDIGLGDSGYKSRWGARGEKKFVDLIAFPPTVRGRLLYAATSAKFRLDELRSRCHWAS